MKLAVPENDLQDRNQMLRAQSDEEGTGLPGLGSWPAVYSVVVLTFVVWVALLVLLAKTFP